MNLFLAFDGGGTRTRGGLYDERRALLAECIGGPSNPVLVGMDAAVDTVAAMSHELLSKAEGKLVAAAYGLAGVGAQSSDRALADALVPRVDADRIVATNDLCPVLFANAGTHSAVSVIAGTGSSIRAQSADGRCVIAGGRGTVVGDDGSAHQLAVAGLRAAADAIDGVGPQTRLVDALPKAAGLSSFSELVEWCNATTSKDAIAGLAKAVTEAASGSDEVAVGCIQTQAELLAKRAVAAYRRLGLSEDAPLLLNGGLFENAPLYRQAFLDALRRLAPTIHAELAPLRGHRAVLELAMADSLPDYLPIAVATRQ